MAMTRIYVSPYRRQNGEWTKRRVLFAAFRSRHDADLYYDKLRADNPTWIIEVRQ